MPDFTSKPPQANGVLETSLYVESAARSAEFYRHLDSGGSEKEGPRGQTTELRGPGYGN